MEREDFTIINKKIQISGENKVVKEIKLLKIYSTKKTNRNKTNKKTESKTEKGMMFCVFAAAFVFSLFFTVSPEAQTKPDWTEAAESRLS